MKKVWTILFICMGFLLTAMPTLALASTENSNSIVITKLKNNSASAGTETTGAQIKDTASLTGNTISGITFKLYKTNYSVAPTGNEILWTGTPTNADTSQFSLIATQTTNDNGQATFSDLDDGIYYVTEEESDLVVKPIEPFYVNLPYTNAETGEAQNTVYVYPKNVLHSDREIVLTKSVNGIDSRLIDVVSSGETIKYQITADLPTNYAQLTSLSFQDTLTAPLSFNRDSLTLSQGDVTYSVGEDYTIGYTANDSGNVLFNLSFTPSGLKKVIAEAPENNDIFINYTVTVPAGLTAATVYPNTASCSWTDSQNTEILSTNATAQIATAQIQVHKTGKNGSIENSLSGVVFGLYTKNTDGSYTSVMNPADPSQAWTVTTDTDGNAVFSGLGEGVYYLHEESLGSNTDYAISENYQAVSIAELGTADEQGYIESNGVVSSTVPLSITVNLVNYLKSSLPLTGGMLIPIGLGALILIGTGFYMIRKMNRQA